MIRIVALVAGMAIVVAACIDTAQAQGVPLLSPPKPAVPATGQSTPKAVPLVAVKPSDIRVARDGSRLTKFVGIGVFDEANDPIGTIRDMIILSDESTAFAVVSVGDFLGTGSRYVVVPISALRIYGKRIILRGSTRKSLMALPEYRYPL